MVAHLRLPLPTLLSQALIAFTIELDNEWERRMPHRTTDFGGDRGVWATSLRQWSNFMEWVPEDGIAAAELARAARAEPALHAMRRWGYVEVERRVVRPRRGGLAAQRVWRPLPAEIEERWRGRLGAGLISALRDGLAPVAGAREAGLPDWLVSIYGGYAEAPVDGAVLDPDRARPLSALLSIPLQAFALEFEHDSAASLMFTANVLRPVGDAGDSGVAAAELPRRSGVAVPALQAAIGILAKRGFIEHGVGRGRVVRLTALGAAELDAYESRCATIERRWELARSVRAALEELLAPGTPLWPAIAPPPESWRARVPRPERLPHHPMPRQGGHPDGV